MNETKSRWEEKTKTLKEIRRRHISSFLPRSFFHVKFSQFMCVLVFDDVAQNKDFRDCCLLRVRFVATVCGILPRLNANSVTSDADTVRVLNRVSALQIFKPYTYSQTLAFITQRLNEYVRVARVSSPSCCCCKPSYEWCSELAGVDFANCRKVSIDA